MPLAERIADIHERLAVKRESMSTGGGMGALSGVANLLPTSVVTSVARAAAGKIDFATSNLRGAPFTLYVSGARVLDDRVDGSGCAAPPATPRRCRTRTASTSGSSSTRPPSTAPSDFSRRREASLDDILALLRRPVTWAQQLRHPRPIGERPLETVETDASAPQPGEDRDRRGGLWGVPHRSAVGGGDLPVRRCRSFPVTKWSAESGRRCGRGPVDRGRSGRASRPGWPGRADVDACPAARPRTSAPTRVHRVGPRRVEDTPRR